MLLGSSTAAPSPNIFATFVANEFGVSGTRLCSGGCEFHPYPAAERVARYRVVANQRQAPAWVVARAATSRKPAKLREADLFLGQLPHLLPTENLLHAVDTALRVYGTAYIRLLPRSTSAHVWLHQPLSAEEAIPRLNGRVVFDVSGFYILRTEVAAKRFLDAFGGHSECMDARIPSAPLLATVHIPVRPRLAPMKPDKGDGAPLMPFHSADHPTFRGPPELFHRQEALRRRLRAQFGPEYKWSDDEPDGGRDSTPSCPPPRPFGSGEP
jgi:hypothetical protein